MPKSKQHLLKFCGPTKNALSNLESGVIFCQHYSAYNDPFEFWTQIDTGVPDAENDPRRFLAALKAWGYDLSSIDEVLDDRVFCKEATEYFHECNDYGLPFDQMRMKMRIACFGSKSDNLLMWSHYADGLRGFCIIFDSSLVVSAEPEGYLVEVSYAKAPPSADSLIYGISRDQDWYHRMIIEEEGYNPSYQEAADVASKQMVKIWQDVFAAKPTEWKYEGERRLLVQSSRSDTAPVLRQYPRDAIKEVILGERMADDCRVQILALMEKRYPRVPVRTARRAKGCYNLVID